MKRLTLLTVAVSLGACGTGDSANTDDRQDTTVGAEVASGYTQQMNKAREVEIQIQDQKLAIDAALEESVQGTRDP